MSLVLQVKRAARDKGLYNGETDSLNWEPSHVVMYNLFCNRFGGHFSEYPSRLHQNPEFLEFIDKYSDPEYTEGPTETSPTIQGAVLRDFVPEALPVNTENATAEEKRKRNEAVNGNVIRTVNKPPEPPKAVKDENKAIVISNSDAKTLGENNASSVSIPNNEQISTTAKDKGTEGTGTSESNASTVEVSRESINTVNPGTKTPGITSQVGSQPGTSSNAQGNTGGTVKVR